MISPQKMVEISIPAQAQEGICPYLDGHPSQHNLPCTHRCSCRQQSVAPLRTGLKPRSTGRGSHGSCGCSPSRTTRKRNRRRSQSAVGTHRTHNCTNNAIIMFHRNGATIDCTVFRSEETASNYLGGDFRPVVCIQDRTARIGRTQKVGDP